MKLPRRPRQGNRQEKRGGEKIPPAPPRVIRCVRLGCQYEFFSGSHTLQFSRFSLLLSIITSPRLGEPVELSLQNLSGRFGWLRLVPPHPGPPSGRGNNASRAAGSRGALDRRKRSVRFSLSSGKGLL